MHSHSWLTGFLGYFGYISDTIYVRAIHLFTNITVIFALGIWCLNLYSCLYYLLTYQVYWVTQASWSICSAIIFSFSNFIFISNPITIMIIFIFLSIIFVVSWCEGVFMSVFWAMGVIVIIIFQYFHLILFIIPILILSCCYYNHFRI